MNKNYESPRVEVIEIEIEGSVLTASLNGFEDGGNA